MAHNRALPFFSIAIALAGCPAEDDGNDDAADTTDGSATTPDDDASGPDDDSATGPDTGSASADSTGGDVVDPLSCPGAGGAGAPGDACTDNDECQSGVCTIFTDVPINEDAVCGEPITTTAAGCNTRITGTVFDFATRMPVEGAEVNVAGAVSAVGNPTGAMSLASATSGADGRIDVTTEVPVMQAIAIVALTSSPSGFLTATGLASPIEEGSMVYPLTSGIHDLWLVPTGPLAEWSTALEGDAEIDAGELPLGEQGGVIGLVRDATGAPIAGATVAPVAADSSAIVRYVNMDNTVNPDMTSETGIFIVIGANQFGEDFEASMGGSPIATGTAGATDNAVFTLILNGD